MLLFDWGGGETAIKTVAVDCYKVVSLYGIHALWYLSSYLIAVWIYLYFVQKLKGLQVIFFILFAVSLGVVFSEGGIFLKGILPSVIFTAINLLITAIIRPIVCTVFIIFGHYLYLYCLKESSQTKSGLVGLGFLGFSFGLSLFSKESNFSIMDYGVHPFVFFLVAAFGAIGLLLFVRFVCTSNSILQYFGRNSLLFLITHHSLKITYLSVIIATYFISDQNYFFEAVAFVVLIIIDTFVVEFIKRRCPWMIVRRENLS